MTDELKSLTNNLSKMPDAGGTSSVVAAGVLSARAVGDFDRNAAAMEVLRKFYNIIQDAEKLHAAAEYLLNELIDDAVFGILLEVNQLRKSGNLVVIDGIPEACVNENSNAAANVGSSTSATAQLHTSGVSGGGSSIGGNLAITLTSESLRMVDLPNADIFGMSTAKKPMDCTCPNCDRIVAAARFAPHLEKCMGMGRLSSRIASRRLATKDVNSSGNSGGTGSSASSLTATSSSTACNPALIPLYLNTSNSVPTDDEDDVEWSSSEKRRKKNYSSLRNNGAKKSNGKSAS